MSNYTLLLLTVIININDAILNNFMYPFGCFSENWWGRVHFFPCNHAGFQLFVRNIWGIASPPLLDKPIILMKNTPQFVVDLWGY